MLRAEDRANARQMMDSELEPQLRVYFDAVDAYIDDQSTRAQASTNLARHTVLTSWQSIVGAAQLHGRAARLHHDGGIFQLSAAIDR